MKCTSVSRLVKPMLIGGAVVALAGAMPAPAQAQSQADIDALRAQIKALQERLDHIESQQKTGGAAAGAGVVTAKSGMNVQVSGLLQVQGNAYLSDKQKGTDARDQDSFRLRRGEIRITSDINDRTSANIMIDPAKRSNFASQAGNVLQDLEIDYRLHNAANFSSTARVGQFKIPIGYEGDLVSTAELPFTERALMYRARDPFGGGYGDIRDTGAQLQGKISQLNYYVGAFNGWGDRQNTFANSSNKAWMGRLVWSPQSMPALKVGVSGGIGGTGVAAGPATAVRSDRSAFNGFAAWNHEKWSLSGEYLTANSSFLGGPTLKDIKSYYGGLGYDFTKKLQGVLRYDYFNFDRHNSGNDIKELSAGLNYRVGHNSRIQADIVRFRGNAGVNVPAGQYPIENYQNDSTQLRTEYQVTF